MKRIALLAGLLAAYVAVLGRGPAAGLFAEVGGVGKSASFDPLAARPAAVEQLIAAGHFGEALPIALALREEQPNEPLVFYWIARLNHRLSRWREEADAWTAYVRTSAAPEEACPAWPDAYRRSGDQEQAAAAAARCRDMARQ